MTAYQPMTTTGQSFGYTTTPTPGWDCGCPLFILCGRCCSVPIHFSDNRKSWGETGELVRSCCSSNWKAQQVRFQPGGEQFSYEYHVPCCKLCGSPYLTVHKGPIVDGAKEIGRLEQPCNLFPCGKTLVNALDASGQSRFTTRCPDCGCEACCPYGCCGGGCKLCDCGCWNRFDSVPIYGPEGTPSEPRVTHLSNMFHRCLPLFFPAWVGFDNVPAMSEDDKALLFGFVLLYGNPWNRYGVFSAIEPASLMQ